MDVDGRSFLPPGGGKEGRRKHLQHLFPRRAFNVEPQTVWRGEGTGEPSGVHTAAGSLSLHWLGIWSCELPPHFSDLLRWSGKTTCFLFSALFFIWSPVWTPLTARFIWNNSLLKSSLSWEESLKSFVSNQTNLHQGWIFFFFFFQTWALFFLNPEMRPRTALKTSSDCFRLLAYTCAHICFSERKKKKLLSMK